MFLNLLFVLQLETFLLTMLSLLFFLAATALILAPAAATTGAEARKRKWKENSTASSTIRKNIAGSWTSIAGLVIVSWSTGKPIGDVEKDGSRQGKMCLSLCEAIEAFSEIAIERHTLVSDQSYWIYSFSEAEHINTTRSFSPIANSCDENSKAFYSEPTSAITEYPLRYSVVTAGLAPTLIC